MHKLLTRTLIMIVSLLLLWGVIVYGFGLPTFILPSPVTVFQTLYQSYPLILHQSATTITEALLGFIFGATLGMLFAIVVAQSKLARLWFLPLLLTSQALPVFVLAPLFVLWLGYGESSKILTCMLMVFFPVTSAFYDGLRHTPKNYTELAQTMGASSKRLLWYIKIPSALPYLASGLRMAAVFSPMGAIIGEWVGASRGLGFLILNANARMQMDMVFAVLIVIVVFTLAFYFIVDRLLKYFLRSMFVVQSGYAIDIKGVE
jgi:putative hydroxymethylpyrimidine transport system permease protein